MLSAFIRFSGKGALSLGFLLLMCLLGPLSFGAVDSPAEQFSVEMPVSYEGQLPCADCPGVIWKLDLWPGGRFHLAQEYIDRQALPGRLGQWRYDALGHRLILSSPGRDAVFLSVIEGSVLRMLDRKGGVIASELNYDLQRQSAFNAAEFPVSLEGGFRYYADAASFTDCATGFRYAVLMAEQFLDLERAYLAQGLDAGKPWFIRIDAHMLNQSAMEGEGEPQSLLINDFAAAPESVCSDL